MRSPKTSVTLVLNLIFLILQLIKSVCNFHFRMCSIPCVICNSAISYFVIHVVKCISQQCLCVSRDLFTVFRNAVGFFLS